ncbi:hypothetical protein CVT26_010535, partial [Gymnopilus dilepis]
SLEKQLPKRTSRVPSASLDQPNLGRGVELQIADKPRSQDECNFETRNADPHPAEAPQNESRQQNIFGLSGAFKLEDSHSRNANTYQAPAKTLNEWPLDKEQNESRQQNRFGLLGPFKQEDSHSRSTNTYQAPAMTIDEWSLAKEQSTLFKPRGLGVRETPKDRFWNPVSENGGEHVLDGGEDFEDSAREMIDKGKKKARCRKPPKEPPPPHVERQYYPQPCRGCIADSLPCFLPVRRRSSRRTCWHCQQSKIKCSYTANSLLQKKLTQPVASKMGHEKMHEDAGRYTITVDDEDESELEEEEFTNDPSQSNAKYREEFEELKNHFAVLVESCQRQEQRFTEFFEAYSKREDSLLKSLTTSLEKAIQTSLDAVVERNYRGLSLDSGEVPSGQVGDDQLADYFSWKENSGPGIDHLDHISSPHTTCEERLSGALIKDTSDNVTVLQLEHPTRCHSDSSGCSISPDSASGLQIGQVEVGLFRAHPDAVVDAEQKAEPRRILAQGEPETRESGRRNVANVGDEIMMAADGTTHSVLDSGLDGILKQDCSTRVKCVRFDDAQLYEGPMSPLSDIPEEEESDEDGKHEPPSCPPSRSTRSSSKRKEGCDIVSGHRPQAKKSKSSSPGAARGRPPKRSV